ncbi:MAG: hypothetical protein MUO54_08250, partial [Anaerolineales bacterium]|nr:hypothetical protein [Anaerolineales bacterium]
MKIWRFDDPEVFRNEIQDNLIIKEAENNLPLGIINNLISGEYRDQDPYLAFVEENNKPVIAILCTPPFPAIFSYQNPPPSDEVLNLVLDDLIDFLGDEFVGISGNKKLVDRLKDIWQELTGRKAELHMAMRIYKLDEVLPVPKTAGMIRPAEKEDRRLMVDWYSGFHRDAMLEAPDLVRVQKQVDIYLEADPKVRGLMFWEKDGFPVSMAGYAGPTPNGIRIGAVYTPPEQRKQGYASAVTAGLSQY